MGKALHVITILPTSHEEIVTRYIVEKRQQALAERESFAREPMFEAAVRRAALALNVDGTVHDHQITWVWPEVREAWAEKLVANLALLEAAASFEDLHDHHLTSLRIKGIGKLTLYDTAYRIGSKLGLEPRLVYLHRGTLEGAVLLGFSRKRPTLEPSELPPAYRALLAYEIEDCLCMYKKDIARIVGP
jgi:hypothetical protein